MELLNRCICAKPSRSLMDRLAAIYAAFLRRCASISATAIDRLVASPRPAAPHRSRARPASFEYSRASPSDSHTHFAQRDAYSIDSEKKKGLSRALSLLSGY
uniref:Uncharacterized protein n=1 Tax=Plectus sambesii TaxID=2011161 RepID=A0A914W296_9BILA